MPGDQFQNQPDELMADLAGRYFERLRLFATRRLRDAGLGEEVAQETLRRSLEALRNGRVNNLEALPAFLFETARNICMHRQRASGRETRALERYAGEVHTSAVHPLDTLITAEEIAAVRNALERLPVEDRQLLLWSYQDGLDAGEVAERLGISTGAVRVRRHRARNRLADLLSVTSLSEREQS
jgi:RNA polymerase sigma factor (sigma-70 family)